MQTARKCSTRTLKYTYFNQNSNLFYSNQYRTQIEGVQSGCAPATWHPAQQGHQSPTQHPTLTSPYSALWKKQQVKHRYHHRHNAHTPCSHRDRCSAEFPSRRESAMLCSSSMQFSSVSASVCLHTAASEISNVLHLKLKLLYTLLQASGGWASPYSRVPPEVSSHQGGFSPLWGVYLMSHFRGAGEGLTNKTGKPTDKCNNKLNE